MVAPGDSSSRGWRFEALIANQAAHNSPILLFDVAAVVLTVRASAGERDVLIRAVLDQRGVQELAATVGVQAGNHIIEDDHVVRLGLELGLHEPRVEDCIDAEAAFGQDHLHELADVLVVIQNQDEPGVIGTVGTSFGDASVNIADMVISRAYDKDGKATALMVIKTDSEPPAALLNRLRARPYILRVRSVVLPARGA